MYLWGELCLFDLVPKGAWYRPWWARAAREPSFTWLLDFFLFPTLVVEDVSGIANASDVVLLCGHMLE
jgi:hypothetical protein